VLGAYLTRHIAYHRAEPRHEPVSGQPAFQERYDAIAGGLVAHGVPLADTHQRALAVIDAIMMKQASMQAYNDAWLLLLLCFICVVPAVFLLKKPKAHAAAVDAH